MLAESTSGPTVTLEPPGTQVSTARAKTTFRLIVMCRKCSDVKLKENTSSVEGCRQGTDPVVLCYVTQGGGAKPRHCPDPDSFLFTFALLTKQTAALHLLFLFFVHSCNLLKRSAPECFSSVQRGTD